MLVVEVHPERTSVEFLRLDPRMVHDVTCDLTGARFAEVARERLERALADVPAEDLVRVKLVGRRAARLDLGWLERFARDRFHLAVDSSGLRPDLDLDDWPSEEEARTIEERFVARLKSMGESGDDALARRAMLYGLDALQQGRIDLRYED